MVQDNINLAKIEVLLRKLLSFSTHDKMDFLASNKGASAEAFPADVGSIAFVVPERFYEEASGLLREIDIVTQNLDQQLTGAESAHPTERQDSRKVDLGEIFLEREKLPIVRGSLRLVQRRPFIFSVSMITALFIQKIDKKFGIMREDHGWGYHL